MNVATQTTKNSNSRSSMEREPYNNWSNRILALTMMDKTKPETAIGYWLGNQLLKPLVGEGISRLSESLMGKLFPTKKEEPQVNIDSLQDTANDYFANKFPRLGAEPNTLPYGKYETPNVGKTKYFNPSSRWEELTKKFSVQ